MPNAKIGDYFTPPLPRNKRIRAQVSPGGPDSEVSNMGDGKVGDMSLEQLMSGLSNLLDSKLDEKLLNLATKDDILGINDKVEELASENKNLREEIILLKKQTKISHEKLIDLESRSRRNNLIFKGLKWTGKRPDFREVIRNFCREVLGCTERVWVNRVHPVGRDGKSIIAHIPDDGDVEYILNQTRNLKGTGFIIHRDFPREIRIKRSRLVAVRAEIDRVARGLKMPLVHDHLYVKGKRLTWEEGRLREGPIDGAQVLKSMFKHDFTDFLNHLSQSDYEQRSDSPPPESSRHSYAQVTAHGSPNTTTMQAASQEKTSKATSAPDQLQAGSTQTSTSQGSA